MHRITKFLCMVILGLMLFDGIADSAECHDSPGSPVCHACVCQTHLTAPASTESTPIIEASAKRIVMKDAVLNQRLFDKFIFHPPKVSA